MTGDLSLYAAKLSAWKDEHHDCDCRAGTSCGCVELREIIQTMEAEAMGAQCFDCGSDGSTHKPSCPEWSEGTASSLPVVSEEMVEAAWEAFDNPEMVYTSRRAMDKSCWEVVEDRDPDGPISDESISVVARHNSSEDADNEADERNARLGYRAALTAALSLPRPASDKGEEPAAWRGRFRTKWAVNSWSYSDGPEKPPWESWNGERGHDLEPLYARPSPGVSREEVARTIGDNFSPNVTFDKSSAATQLACFRAADAVRGLLSRGEG